MFIHNSAPREINVKNEIVRDKYIFTSKSAERKNSWFFIHSLGSYLTSSQIFCLPTPTLRLSLNISYLLLIDSFLLILLLIFGGKFNIMFLFCHKTDMFLLPKTTRVAKCCYRGAINVLICPCKSVELGSNYV